MNKYIGIDVAKATLQIYIPRSHPSSVGMYTRVTITKQTINPKKAIILNGKK